MLDLVLTPERSLGCEQWEFVLGMHFSQAVAIIQSQVGVIKGVQVLYSDLNPLAVDLVINLPIDGIRLIFDPTAQRLKLIEIYNMKSVKLKYNGNIFNSPTIPPTVDQIEHTFGATTPGLLDPATKIYCLNFRGVSFYFPMDNKLQPGHFRTGMKLVHFPQGAQVSRCSVYCGSNAVDARAPPLPIGCYQQQLYLESAEVLRVHGQTMGLRLKLYTECSARLMEPRKQTLSKELLFGDSCQDVASNLGAPCRVFYKSEDKMRIHSPCAHRKTPRRSDFFYNYFTLGLDVLFDARTQRLKKIVLHTNYPGHYNFNMYHRCEFHMQLMPQSVPSDASFLVDVSPTPVLVSAYTKWDNIKDQLRPHNSPVVLNRASSTNTTNPFGSTFCFGYQDIIFEVMPNEYIASVTLHRMGFQDSTSGSDSTNQSPA